MFLGATCIDHGQAATSPADTCCPGLTPWTYDANTGQAYSLFDCWNATCAGAGQWAGPSGVGNRCCAPLVNVNGKCGTAPSGGGTYVPPSSLPPISSGSGNIIPGVDNMILYAVAGGLVLLMFMSKKKGA